MKNFIKNLKKFNKRKKKSLYEKIFIKIKKEIPELTQEYPPHGRNYLSPHEQVRIYQELKSIKSQKWNIILAIVTIVLASITAPLAYNSYQLQKTTSAALNPLLQFDDLSPISVSTINWAGYNYNSTSYTLNPKNLTISFSVTNYGQLGTGMPPMYFLREQKNRFNTRLINNFPIAGVGQMNNPATIRFSANLKKSCSFSGTEDENNKLNSATNDIPSEIMNWFLKIECKNCNFPQNPTCFSFKICSYNNNDGISWCQSNAQNTGNLTNIDCSEINF